MNSPRHRHRPHPPFTLPGPRYRQVCTHCGKTPRLGEPGSTCPTRASGQHHFVRLELPTHCRYCGEVPGPGRPCPARSGGRHHFEGAPDDGCFLTTACVSHAGLADDCELLMLLRQFRDDYLLRLRYGAVLVKLYYATAPAIVAAIDARPPAVRAKLYGAMLPELQGIAEHIKQNHPQKACVRYLSLCLSILARVLVPR